MNRRSAPQRDKLLEFDFPQIPKSEPTIHNSPVSKKVLKNIIGWTSAILLLVAYALLVMDIITHKSFSYNTMNLLAGIGLAWRVYQDKNYSNFVLELVFIAVALLGIAKGILL